MAETTTAPASAEEFERRYAERSGLTVEELRAAGRVVRPCDCDDELCEGWKSVSAEIAEEPVRVERYDWKKRRWVPWGKADPTEPVYIRFLNWLGVR